MNKRHTILEWLFGGIILFTLSLCAFPNFNDFLIKQALALQVQINQTPVMNFILRNSSNTSQYLTGLTNSTVTVTYKNAGKGWLAMTGCNVVEANATANPGSYNLTPTADVTNITGELLVWMNSSASLPCVRTYDIVANLTSDDVAATLTRGTSNLTTANLGGLTNVTLNGTQAFNVTGNKKMKLFCLGEKCLL